MEAASPTSIAALLAASAAATAISQINALVLALSTTANTLSGNYSRVSSAPIANLYESNDAFNLATRAGDRVFQDISKPLGDVWDSTTQNFPDLLSSLNNRASDGC
eukprot:CAMPEP_0197835454 /NCGR_PEP_ID=MMETSP1437-20131217/25797_1 /TAXON_ID=49252 ORGANISM="Eucampia antarctica, Strain CCMP1452" /NCGR_SAMPLE_ID=MMETSP1437 /ASSEMBLY_ACC=CAM_ASM_001096 /LENGTH=105 /DNA_ID=CAMNT_0043440903 /DNA_START=102 /DNA_END=419 /DNA_ORIENTATION=+